MHTPHAQQCDMHMLSCSCECAGAYALFKRGRSWWARASKVVCNHGRTDLRVAVDVRRPSAKVAESLSTGRHACTHNTTIFPIGSTASRCCCCAVTVQLVQLAWSTDVRWHACPRSAKVVPSETLKQASSFKIVMEHFAALLNLPRAGPEVHNDLIFKASPASKDGSVHENGRSYIGEIPPDVRL